MLVDRKYSAAHLSLMCEVVDAYDNREKKFIQTPYPNKRKPNVLGNLQSLNNLLVRMRTEKRSTFACFAEKQFSFFTKLVKYNLPHISRSHVRNDEEITVHKVIKSLQMDKKIFSSRCK